MSKSVKGDPKYDENAQCFKELVKQFGTHKNLNNLDQNTLWDLIFEVDILRAKLNRYEMIRNKQGRGGKK